MSINWKRILLLIGFVAAVFLIGFLLYYFFLKPTLPSTEPVTNTNGTGALPGAGSNVNIQTAGNTNGALPGTNANSANQATPPPDVSPNAITVSEIANGGLTKTTALTETVVYQPTLDQNSSEIIYYDKSTGLFYKIATDGKATPLSDQIFHEVQNVTWSPDKQKAVLEYPDSSKIVYDFSTNKQVTLPKHWKEFSFSPTSDRLVFKSMGSTEETRWIAVANADGSEATKVEHLGNQDKTVDTIWSPAGQIVAMYRKDKDFDRQNLYFLGQNNENFKSTIIEGRGFEGQWSTDGSQLLYSVYSSNTDYKPSLWLVSANGESIGQNRKNLQIQTWSNKCTFANTTSIYCAVPRQLSSGAGIFSSEMDTSPCDIYKIDLTSGNKTKVAIPQGNQNINDVLVTKDESYLYFTSKTDGLLYKINLK
ncbi:MAG: hypothetical protein WCW26_04875 [Candidatus Buchananbacteria bacterium]